MKPYYSEEGIDIYCGDCREVVPSLSPLACLITDPPYSHYTHNKQWIGAALTSQAKPRVSTKFKGLGFDPLTPELMGFICQQAVRVAQRWSLFFSDLETISTWQMMLQGAGLEYVRSCIWDKIDSAPQFTGDRPAAGVACFDSPLTVAMRDRNRTRQLSRLNLCLS